MMKIVPEPDVRELLQQQGQAIESMTRLLNALLDISRLESGAIEPVSAEVSVADVFEELRSEFASVARTRTVDLQVDPSPSRLSTDRTLFYQLLQNLLGNALKYTDRGWVRLACVGGCDAACGCRRGFRNRHSGGQARAHLRRVLSGRYAWHEANGRRVWASRS